jgi:hypothetical protein
VREENHSSGGNIMADRDSMSVNRRLFDLGARLGSLEGYLYAEERVEKNYLPGWIENIISEFGSLPPEIRSEIAKDYGEVWRKVEALVLRIYGENDPTTLKVRAVLKNG